MARYIQITMAFKFDEWEKIKKFFPDEVNKSAVAKKYLLKGIEYVRVQNKKRR